MIGRIQGLLQAIDDTSILVDVGGIGYEVEVTQSARKMLGAVGDTVTLATHFVVREDAQLLYGFESKAERDLFRTLIKINSVGPKVALGLLSWTSAVEFVRLVRTEDIAGLTRAPGIGRKTAERLVVELKDRVAELATEAQAVAVDARIGRADVLQEAERALIALGYRPQEAARLLDMVHDPELDVGAIVKLALQAAGRAQETAQESAQSRMRGSV